MQKTIFAMLAVMLIGIGMVAYSQVAYAEEDISDEILTKIASDTISSTLAIAGTGMVAGSMLSVIRVIGKHVKETNPEGFALNKFIVTVIVGGIVGAILGYMGLSAEAAIGIDFIVVFFLTQTVFPVMKNRKWKAK